MAMPIPIDCDLDVTVEVATANSTMPRRTLQRKSPMIPGRTSSQEFGSANSNEKRLNRSSTLIPNIEESGVASEREAAAPELENPRASATLLPEIAGIGEISSDASIEGLMVHQEEAEEIAPKVPRKDHPFTLPVDSTLVLTPTDVSQASTTGELPNPERLESDSEISSMTSTQLDGLEKPEEVEHILKQLVETTQKLETSYTHCQALTDEVKKLQKDVEDAHDFIFTLQPRRNLITPSDATDEFKSLCLTVEEWVQTKLGDVLDEPISKDVIGKPDNVEKLMSWITPRGREAFHVPETDEYNVIAAIMNFLCRQIFDLDFWCPVEPGALPFLDSIESSMRNLQPPRDFATIRTWRSDTLTALANRPDFSSRRDQRIRALTIELKDALRVFLPKVDPKELCENLQSSIIDRAVHLAHKFHLSIDKFEIEWSNLTSTNANNADITEYECQNLLGGGRILKFPAASARNNTYIMDVSPGLYYHAVKANSYGEAQVLKKPRILVASMKMEGGEYNPGRHQTLLGWLEQSRSSKKHHGSWL